MDNQEKNKKHYGLVKRFFRLSFVWKAVVVLLLLIGTFSAGRYAVKLVGDVYEWMSADRYYVVENMGGGYEFRCYYDGPNRISRKGRIRTVVKNVDLVKGDSSDGLWLVRKNDSFAFFNIHTGRMMSPFIYQNAWPYSEGVAAVVDSDYRLFFINLQGEVLYGRTFAFNALNDGEYLFHNGFCQVIDTSGMAGIIDLSGNWVMQPQYDDVLYNAGYWSLTMGDSLMVLDSSGNTLIQMTRGQELRVIDNGDLEIWHQLYPGKLYDASGRLLARQTYYDIKCLSYDEDDEECNTDVLVYYTEYDQCGLLSKDGRVLTDARFYDIKAIGDGLFRASYRVYEDGDSSVEVLLNEKGELVERARF